MPAEPSANATWEQIAARLREMLGQEKPRASECTGRRGSSQGIAWVLVNGRAVVADGKPTNALPGQILRGPGYKPGTP